LPDSERCCFPAVRRMSLSPQAPVGTCKIQASDEAPQLHGVCAQMMCTTWGQRGVSASGWFRSTQLLQRRHVHQACLSGRRQQDPALPAARGVRNWDFHLFVGCHRWVQCESSRAREARAPAAAEQLLSPGAQPACDREARCTHDTRTWLPGACSSSSAAAAFPTEGELERAEAEGGGETTNQPQAQSSSACA